MIRINLLKPEAKDIKETPAEGMPEFKAKKRPGVGNLIFLLLIIALAGVFLYQKRLMDQERRLLTEAKKEKNELQYVIAKLDQLEKQKLSLERKISLIVSLKAQQEMAVRTMDEISRLIPDWVWLNEISFDSKNVQIRGNALSNNLLADYIASLENSPYFENVNLISSTQKTIRASQYLEFALTATMVNPKAPPAAPKPPPPAKETTKRRTP